ncbi:three-Cys-motif partner protein TcmP [bacterium]|nr:three-Cys-motif partner protein TcmP [bacterium]
MKRHNKFFDEQSDLTASKILIYQQYLKNYLPKVLMQFGKCFIADFFCGPGKNGDQDGSPLILLDAAKSMLESPMLRKKWQDPEVFVVFSDMNKKHVDNLSESLKQRNYPVEIKIVGPLCEKFDSILSKTINVFGKVTEPKFFFLDPFTYSDVTIDDVKTLIDTPSSEVLLFLPTFHSYRFVSCADDVVALKQFLENFTDRGCADYSNITDFNESIRQRLLTYLNLKYVRSIGLDDGAKKNALFHLTKHITGTILMNKLVWKYANDGVTVRTKRDNEPTLFNLSTLSNNFVRLKQFLQGYIKEEKVLTNVEIIEVVAQKGFTNKYANEILKDMQKQGLIEVEYKTGNKIRGFYIADSNWNKDLAIIKYKEQ